MTANIYCLISGKYSIYRGFPGGSDGRERTCNVGDLASIPGSGRSPGEGNSYPLQYSGLENPMDRSLTGYTLWGCKELDTAKRLSLSFFILLSMTKGLYHSVKKWSKDFHGHYTKADI